MEGLLRERDKTEMENIKRLANKIVDIIADWEGHSTSTLTELRMKIEKLLKEESNERYNDNILHK